MQAPMERQKPKTPLERCLNMLHSPEDSIQQFAREAVDFSSQYGSDTSISYTVSNIAGNSEIYPNYGDFTNACVLRTYGPWWSDAPSGEKIFSRVPTSFVSEDFIDLSYNEKVFPLKLQIYETYNPGTVVRILACDHSAEEGYTSTDHVSETYNPGTVVRILACDHSAEEGYTSTDHVRWFVLWSGQSDYRCSKSHIFSPELRICPFQTNLIRLEFNSQHCNYYTELDAVSLTGTKLYPGKAVTGDRGAKTNTPTTSDNQEGANNDACDIENTKQNGCLLPCCRNSKNSSADSDSPVNSSNEPIKFSDAVIQPMSEPDTSVGIVAAEKITQGIAQLHLQDGGLSAALDASDNGCFDLLPGEVIQYIMSYLDLSSLGNLAAACHLFHSHVYDPYKYTELSLKPYWTTVTGAVLQGLVSRCRHLQGLDLSWCGAYNHITSSSFMKFLSRVCTELACLRLCCCQFVDDDILSYITQSCNNLTELNLQSCKKVKFAGFVNLKELTKLQRLNLYRTNIDQASICNIIRSCSGLEHVNVGSCVNISDYNEVAQLLGQHCRGLKSVDLWRARSFTHLGLNHLSEGCKHLQEIDIGWCSAVSSPTGCVRDLAQKCKYLKKIYLTANRTVSDRDLEAMSRHLSDLEQLDILGTNEVTEHAVQRLLTECRKLKFFDISFCGQIKWQTVRRMRKQFPNCDIKKSFQEQQEEEESDD